MALNVLCISVLTCLSWAITKRWNKNQKYTKTKNSSDSFWCIDFKKIDLLCKQIDSYFQIFATIFGVIFELYALMIRYICIASLGTSTQCHVLCLLFNEHSILRYCSLNDNTINKLDVIIYGIMSNLNLEGLHQQKIIRIYTLIFNTLSFLEDCIYLCSLRQFNHITLFQPEEIQEKGGYDFSL